MGYKGIALNNTYPGPAFDKPRELGYFLLFANNNILGNSWAVQWLGHGASTARAQVWSLGLGSCKPCGRAKKQINKKPQLYCDNLSL